MHHIFICIVSAILAAGIVEFMWDALSWGKASFRSFFTNVCLNMVVFIIFTKINGN